MDEKSFYSSNISSEKKKFLSDLTNQKKQKEKLKEDQLPALKIQSFIRGNSIRKNIIRDLQRQLKSKISDIEKLKLLLKKPDMIIPLSLLQDIIRDLIFSNDNSPLFYELLDSILNLIKKSMIAIGSKENFLDYFLCSEFLSKRNTLYSKDFLKKTPISNPLYLPIRVYINMKKTIKLCFLLLQKKFIRFPIALEIINIIFDAQMLKEFFFKNEKSIQAFFEFFQQIYNEFNFYPTLRKILLKVLSSIKILQKNDKNIISLLKISIFPSKIFQNLAQIDKFSTRSAYSKVFDQYNEQISNFVLQIISLPRIAFYLRDESFFQIDWKAIFQSFLYNNITDPLADESNEQFLAKHKKTSDSSDYLYIFGNSIELLDELSKRDLFKVSDYFALMKLISLTLNFVSVNWLSKVLGYQFSEDKDIWYLRSQILILMNQEFTLRIFGMCFELKQNDLSDRFNPYFAFALCELYSGLIILGYQNQESHHIITRISNTLALKEILLGKCLKFLEDFFGFENYLKGNIDKSFEKNFLNVFIIFIIGYTNYLFISEVEDFIQDEIVKKHIRKLISFLLQFIIKNSWFINKPSSIHEFVNYHGSKLLNLCYEFNSKVNFIPINEWFLTKQQINALMDEISSFRYEKVQAISRISFSVPFEYRMQIFLTMLEEEKRKYPETYQMIIRRDNLFEDGFQAFKTNKLNLKAKIRVFYIDEFGMEEKGLDGGGIFKEFLNDICKIVFDPSYGLFKITDKNQQLYPNPSALTLIGNEYKEIYRFIGILIGRALLDNILIGTMFSPFFLRKWIGKHNFLNELQSFDQELHNNLKFLRKYNGKASELGLCFATNDVLNPEKEVELIPGGKNVTVDDSNKFRYIYLVANYKLNEVTREHTLAFLDGLNKIIPNGFLQLFNEYELQMVLSGSLNQLDIEDLKKNVILQGYSLNENYMKDFWKILDEMNENDKNLFVKFVTSCERPPLLGFSKLNPKFTIQNVPSDNDKKLPTSSTCFNKLNLPKYSKKDILKNKLLLAIRSAKGFYLT